MTTTGITCQKIKKVTTKRVIGILMFCLIRVTAMAQDSSFTDRLFHDFDAYSATHLPEKCFVHTDKNDYAPGEMLWFKVYDVDGFYNKPLLLSKVVYTELLDGENNPVLQAKLALVNGDASGSFDLPDTLKAGGYHLRAYSNWMKNSGPDYFFEKDVRIGGAGNGISIPGTLPAPAIGDRKPEQNKELPGYSIQIKKADSGRMEVVLAVPPKTSAGQWLTLFAQAHGLPKLTRTARIVRGEADFSIPESDLGEGLNVFTAFDAERKPVCEKLWFVSPRRQMMIALESSQPQFQTRDAVTISITTADDNGAPLATDLSLSVYRTDSLTVADCYSMPAYLWLNSELPPAAFSGSHSPGEAVTSTAAAMDSFLVSQHWSRFSWKQVFDTPALAPAYAPETRDPVITGRIVSTADGKPAPRIYSYASVAGKETLFRAAESGADGLVRFEMPGFTGSSQVIVQTGSEDSGYRVDLLNPFSAEYRSEPLPKEKKMAGANPALSARLFDTQIQNVYQSDSIQQWKTPVEAASFFYGKPDYRYHLDDYTRFTSMEEVMREYVKACNVFRLDGVVKLVLYNLPAARFFTDPPLVLLDGVPVFEENRPMDIDPLKIRDIELVNREYLLGPQKYSGIINLLSYHADLAGYVLPSQAATVNYEGLQSERKFYSPDYSSAKARNSRVPDYRTQLCWAPSLKTGTEGKTAIRFFASDVPGRYAVVVHGLNSGGIAGSKTIYFNVTAAHQAVTVHY